MPYKHTSDLPDAVRTHLPAHAREIYLKAFNSAWKHYADADKRRGRDSREATAHRVARGAVEQSYHKEADGTWRRNV